MAKPKWSVLQSDFDALPDGIRSFLADYPELLKNFGWNVSWGYLFSQIEAAHRLALYVRVVSKYRVNADKAWDVISEWRMSRDDFDRVFKDLFGESLPKPALESRKKAEAVRDRNIHGKPTDDAKQTQGQQAALAYVDALHAHIVKCGSPSPFQDLRGFAPGEKLPAETSHLVLRGLGLTARP